MIIKDLLFNVCSNNAVYYEEHPVGIVNTFESQKGTVIIFLILNLFFGALFGVIGSIYDLTICNYVTANKSEFYWLERKTSGNI